MTTILKSYIVPVALVTTTLGKNNDGSIKQTTHVGSGGSDPSTRKKQTRTPLPALFIFIVAAVAGTAIPTVGAQFIPVAIGLDFQQPFSDNDILRGFKLNVGEGENPMRLKVFTGEIEPIPYTTVYSVNKVIQSVKAIEDTMEIGGRLGVSYGPLSGEGAGRFLKSTVSSKRQVTVVYRTRRVAYAKQVKVDTLELTNDAALLPPDELAATYGTKFIDGVAYGAQLDVYYTVTSSKEVDVEELEAELKGKIGVGPLSISFEAKFNKSHGQTESDYRLTVVAQASGIDFSVDSNPDFNRTNDIINEFNAKYDALYESMAELPILEVEENVLNQFRPVGFSLASTADYYTPLSKDESAVLDQRMEDLQKVFHVALYWIASLIKAEDEASRKYADPRSRTEIFVPYQARVVSELEVLNAKLTECLLYRRQPLVQLVGRNMPPYPLPNAYPYPGSLQSIAMHGLVGNAYIPSPLFLGNSMFQDMHYIGFSLPNDEAGNGGAPLVAWMSGAMVHDLDNAIVAQADTPDQLEDLGNAALGKSAPRIAGVGVRGTTFSDGAHVEMNRITIYTGERMVNLVDENPVALLEGYSCWPSSQYKAIETEESCKIAGQVVGAAIDDSRWWGRISVTQSRGNCRNYNKDFEDEYNEYTRFCMDCGCFVDPDTQEVHFLIAKDNEVFPKCEVAGVHTLRPLCYVNPAVKEETSGTVVTGIQVDYGNMAGALHGSISKNSTTIDLQGGGKKIVEVEASVVPGYIASLSFQTDDGDVHGPFGKAVIPNVDEIQAFSSVGPGDHLGGFCGGVEDDLRELCFLWIGRFTPTPAPIQITPPPISPIPVAAPIQIPPPPIESIPPAAPIHITPPPIESIPTSEGGENDLVYATELAEDDPATSASSALCRRRRKLWKHALAASLLAKIFGMVVL